MTSPWTHASLGLPHFIEIFGHRIEVVIDHTRDVGKFGDADFSMNLIRLFVSGVCKDVILHTYWHEVVHFILHYAGRPDLTDDETLVDVLGGLLAQVTSVK